MAVPLLLAPSGRPARGVRLALEPLLDRYRIVRGGRLRRVPLSQIATFARGSRAWDFDAAGNLGTYEADVPRNGYSGGQRAGWLLEGQSANLVANSKLGGVRGAINWFPGAFNTGEASTAVPELFAGSAITRHARDNADNNVGGWSISGLTAGTAYVASAYVWIPSDYTGTAPDISLGAGDWTRATSVAVNLSLRNQWQRIYAIGSAATATSVVAYLRNFGPIGTPNSIYSTCWQFEANYCASSHIPTSSSAVTRAHDRFPIGGDAFLQVFDAAAPEGFLFVDVMLPQVAGSVSQHIASLATGSAFTNRIMLWNPSSAGTLGFFSSSGQQASPFTFTPGVPFRLGMMWGGGSVVIASEGVSYEYSSVTPPSLDTLWIGQIGSGNFSPNGRYRGVWAGRKKQSINAFRAASVSGADIEAIFGAAA